LIQVPKQTVAIERIAERARKLDIMSSPSEPKEGVISESFNLTNDALTMRLGFMFPRTFKTIQNNQIVEKTHTELEEIPVIFLSADFVYVGSARLKELWDKVRTFFERHFIEGFVFDRIRFDEAALTRVIEECPDVVKVDVKSTRDRELDLISATGRGRVLDSQLWEIIGDEPKEFVKVILKRLDQQPIVSFRKNGTITIPSTSFSLPEQAIILKHVIERIVGPYLRSRSVGFQSKLYGESTT
jgi:hypothetical protein